MIEQVLEKDQLNHFSPPVDHFKPKGITMPTVTRSVTRRSRESQELSEQERYYLREVRRQQELYTAQQERYSTLRRLPHRQFLQISDH